MKKILTSLAAASSLFLASCAMDATQKQEEALAKSFRPQPGRANLYVCRPGTLTPWVPRFVHIELNGQDLGPAPDADRKFVMFDVAPGNYTISASVKKLLIGNVGAAKHQFRANAGDNVFLEFRPKFYVDLVVASTPVISWSRVTEEEGKRNILKSKLVKGVESVN